MASIQQSLNQTLMLIQHAVGMGKYIKQQRATADALKSIQVENRMIAAAEEEQKAKDAEAKKAGFTDAQQQHEVQLAAERAARDLEEKRGVKVGFYTHEEPTETAFGDPDPSDRYRLPGAIPKYSEPKPPEIKKIDQKALQSFIERTTQKTEMKQALKDRRQFLEEPEEPMWQRGGTSNGI